MLIKNKNLFSILEVAKHALNQSVDSRLELRRDLKCKSFEWYLENIWPTHFMPSYDRSIGRIRNLKTKECLNSPKTRNYGQPYGIASLSTCIIEIYPLQLFIFTPEGYIKTDDSVCLDPPEFKRENDKIVRIMACNNLERQKWIRHSKYIKHLLSGKCLDLNNHNSLILKNCDNHSVSQEWEFDKINWKS